LIYPSDRPEAESDLEIVNVGEPERSQSVLSNIENEPGDKCFGKCDPKRRKLYLLICGLVVSALFTSLNAFWTKYRPDQIPNNPLYCYAAGNKPDEISEYQSSYKYYMSGNPEWNSTEVIDGIYGSGTHSKY
jgi:hypothetical protein